MLNYQVSATGKVNGFSKRAFDLFLDTEVLKYRLLVLVQSDYTFHIGRYFMNI